MKRALFVATVPTHIERFEKNDMAIVQSMGYAPEIACNFRWEKEDSAVYQFTMSTLNCLGYAQHQISFARSPFSKQTLIAYHELKELFKKEHYDVIHCHTPVAGILTRLAARKARKKGTKVIYTAHGFHFFKGAPLLNWLLYYPAEKICSYFTDVLITINQEDYALAQRKMKTKRVCYIPGVGVDTSKFARVEINKAEKRTELGLCEDDFVVLSVGELNANKNHATVIKALGQLKNNTVQYVIAGTGDQKEHLEHLAQECGVNLHLLGYRSDVAELYKMADVFCFPSFREGLSVSLMEAMGIGLPCVVSKIRGNTDLIQESAGGFLLEFDDVQGFSDRISTLAQNAEYRKLFGQLNVEQIKLFDLNIVNKKMREIYLAVYPS